VRALDKDPYQRFESSRHLAKTFAAAITGQVVDDVSGGSGDWSGPHQMVKMRSPMNSDALAIAQSMSGAADSLGGPLRGAAGSLGGPLRGAAGSLGGPLRGAAEASSNQSKVPTFAGTTVDPDVPKRRTLAAVGGVAVLVAVGVGAAFFVLGEEAAPVPEPAAHSAGPAPTIAGTPPAGPTSVVDVPPAATTVASAAPAGSSSADAETVAPAPSAQASSKKPVQHAPRPPSLPRPKTTPKPQPPRDKYGF
jgi:hypothetical protein